MPNFKPKTTVEQKKAIIVESNLFLNCDIQVQSDFFILCGCRIKGEGFRFLLGLLAKDEIL